MQFITYRDVSKVDTFFKQSSQKFLSRLGLVPEINIFFPPLHFDQLDSISFYSYVVYCGLVFVVLSQPYMHHQFGKDWATKSPVRLCERVHTPSDRMEQEVVLLNKV